jgi:hypothetical protein
LWWHDYNCGSCRDVVAGAGRVDARRLGRQSDSPYRVFSARGTHGSYESAGRFSTSCATRLATYRYTGYGKAWRAWMALAPVSGQPWYGLGGAWGEVGYFADTTGPLGPSRFKPAAPAGW